MEVSYDKLWQMLADKKMNKADLIRAAEVGPNTLAKMRRDEPVHLSILCRICNALDCGLEGIVEYKGRPKVG